MVWEYKMPVHNERIRLMIKILFIAGEIERKQKNKKKKTKLKSQKAKDKRQKTKLKTQITKKTKIKKTKIKKTNKSGTYGFFKIGYKISPKIFLVCGIGDI